MAVDCSVTIVGDGYIGKTCLLLRYAEDKVIPEDYIPTVFENYAKNISVGDERVNLRLFDTAGQEEYSKLRLLAYDRTDVFLMGFDLTLPDSLKNCENCWLKELRQHRKKCPIILVGTKKDLLKNTDGAQQIGNNAAREMKLDGFFMTSAVTGENIKEVIEAAARIFLNRRKKRCIIL